MEMLQINQKTNKFNFYIFYLKLDFFILKCYNIKDKYFTLYYSACMVLFSLKTSNYKTKFSNVKIRSTEV